MKLFRQLFFFGFLLLLGTKAGALAPTRSCVTIECPSDMVVDCIGSTGAPVKFRILAANSCGRVLNVTSKPASDSLFPIGTTEVTCVATDDQGNSARCSFKVTVQDKSAPQLELPSTITVPCTSEAGARVEFVVSASDNCDSTPVVRTIPPSGSIFSVGTNLVRCVAIDAAGNESSGSFAVVVTGACLIECIQFNCPTNMTLTLEPDESSVIVNFEVLATNTCLGEAIPVQSFPESGSAFPMGVSVVESSWLNRSGSNHCSFTVTILDKTPPRLALPRPFKVPCTGHGLTGQAGAVVKFRVSASDNSDPAPRVVCNPPSGSYFSVGSHTVRCTAVDASGNERTGEFQLEVYSSAKCEVSVIPNPAVVLPDNWGFEKRMTNWITIDGDAFDSQPNEGDVVPAERETALRKQMEKEIGGDYWRGVDYSVGHKGNFWVSTGHSVQNQPGQLFDDLPIEQLVGTLRSKIFEISTPYISFLLGGGNDMEDLKIELLISIPNPGPNATNIKIGSTTYTLIYPATGNGRELMRRVILPVKDYIGSKAVFRIIDKSATGHLNVDDFRFHDIHPSQENVKLGQQEFASVVNTDGYYYDWDSPVWGFADLHTHPMSYLGFGFKVMHGEPDGNIAEALGDCNCTHGGFGLDNTCGDYVRELVIKMTDSHGIDPHREGYHEDQWKRFRKWPVFSTVTHQQMWHQWIRRAYDGGLRVMVALCVNNPLLATGVKGDGPRRDKEVGDLQIKEMKAFVSRHNDFMEIAYDPVQLRDIVRRNKLAVVLGSELDDIGNIGQNPSVHASGDEVSRTVVKNEIQRLYDLGLRYIFPVHLTDNKFGGTGVGSDMLNIANKFVNNVAFDIKAASATDNINAKLETLDYTPYLGAGIAALTIGPALIPVLEGVVQAVSLDFGPIPPGATSLAAAFVPMALMSFAPVIAIELAADGIPSNIFPLFGNFPTYPDSDHGHRNRKGLTPLGEFAVKEMMRRAMIIDMDHLSQEAVDQIVEISKKIPMGYPLNSGHNSFRELNVERGENNRSPEQMETLRKLGGVMGVGYENAATYAVAGQVPSPKNFSSQVNNDSSGASKTFAQLYLYALEKLDRHGVAFGTDINGLIVGPGPRFGGQGSFGIHNAAKRDNQIKAQENGVLYEPKHGKPLTTAAFAGNAIDPDREFDAARGSLGYAYNKDQRDFFAALRIFFWRKDSMSNNQDAVEAELKQIESGLVGAYDARRVKEYAFGLLKGIKNWEPGSDVLSGDTGTREQLGKAICRHKLLGSVIPDDIKNDADKLKRFNHHLKVWDAYQKIFGANTPMKRSETSGKQWDLNFEGVAHYGLLPDFIQDLHNVGVNHDDLSPLFQSAEHFAQMWTRCLRVSQGFVPSFDLSQFFSSSDPGSGKKMLHFNFNKAGEEFELEESDDISPEAQWHPVLSRSEGDDGFETRVAVPVENTARYYRLKKKN